MLGSKFQSLLVKGIGISTGRDKFEKARGGKVVLVGRLVGTGTTMTFNTGWMERGVRVRVLGQYRTTLLHLTYTHTHPSPRVCASHVA